MARLNQKAYQILKKEIERLSANGAVAGNLQQEIVIKRLEQMRSQSGKPATKQELAHEITDMFPEINQKVLVKAAKANKNTPLFLKIIGLGAVGLTGLGGLIWLVNLPYPMIRRPVARSAPLLLLPSYITMDRDYRQAVSNVEQADQLINQATSKADILLGEEKVNAAQKNLDGLPVWFLGYEPVEIRTFYSFGWKFTFDEYESARGSIGRMKAKVFQEKNALTQLEQAQAVVEQAKQQYQQATTPTEKQKALADWQNGLDRLTQLPPSTLAAKTAQPFIAAYQRDFQQIAGQVATSDRSSKFINVAKQFAQAASKNCQTPPYPVTEWEQCQQLWQQSLDRLNQINVSDADYVEAQSLLAEYQTNLGKVKVNLKAETESSAALEQAQSQIQNLMAFVGAEPSPADYNNIRAKLQGIIDQLEKVKPQTTGYDQAQTLLKSAQDKLSKL